MNDLTYWVALSSTPHISAVRKNQLLTTLLKRQANLATFFNAPENTWPSLGLLTEEEMRLLSQAKASLRNTAFQTEDLLSQGYRLIPVMTPEYPNRVKQRLKYDSPVLLYCRGNMRLLEEPSASVFGSRRPPEAALTFAAATAATIAAERRVLVSGEAQGCDRTALDTVTNADGKAIVVIPEGIMKYGSGFERLYKNISSGKVIVVSCVAPNTYRSSDAAYTRNNLIVGLSDEIIVANADRQGSTYALLESWLRRGVPMRVRTPLPGEQPGNDFLLASGATPA